MSAGKTSSPESSAARARARAIYENVQRDLETRFKGDIVAIEVESGEYFVGPTVGEAAATARTRHPDKPLHFIRLGYSTVYVWR